MRQTYELHLSGTAGGERFRALTCRAEDLILETQKIIAEEGAVAADVFQFGQSLFTVMAATAG